MATRAISRGRLQRPVAPHILAMVLTPADQEAGPIGYQVATKAKRLARKLKVVKADQHYTRKNETFVRPLRISGMLPCKSATRRCIRRGRHKQMKHPDYLDNRQAPDS